MSKDFIKDIAKYLPSQIVPGVLGFISVPIITRLFSPQDYGNYSLVMATIGILTLISGWLPTGIIRFFPVYEKNKKLDIFYGNIILTTLFSIMIITIGFSAMLFIFKSYITKETAFLMLSGIGVFVLASMFTTLQSFLRIRRQVNLFSMFAIWRNVGSLGISLSLIFFYKKEISYLLWGSVLCIFSILPILWKKAKAVPVLNYKIDFDLIKELAGYSFPLLIGNLAASILNVSDRYILQLYRSTYEVGIYSACYNIGNHTVMLITSMFMFSAGPISIRIWENEGESKSKEFIRKSTRYYLMVCIPAVAGMSVLSEPIIKIMTGKQYLEGYKVIPFVTLGFLFLGLQQRFHAGFQYYKRTIFITIIIAVASFFNLILNFIFIPKYGYFAAASTTLVSYIFLLFLAVIFSRRLFRWPFPFKSVLNFIIASGIMGGLIYFVISKLDLNPFLNLIISILSGGFIYFALLFLLKEFSTKEKEFISKTMKKYLLRS